MWRVLLLVIFYVSVMKILTLTLVRVITPVIIERLSLLLDSGVEIIPRDLTRGGAWIGTALSGAGGAWTCRAIDALRRPCVQLLRAATRD